MALFIGIFLTSAPALAGPISLLDCELGNAPVENASVSFYNGRFFLITRSYEGEVNSRIIPKEDWERRILLILDTPEKKGVLYREDGSWYFHFKGDNGWLMKGNANCSDRG